MGTKKLSLQYPILNKPIRYRGSWTRETRTNKTKKQRPASPPGTEDLSSWDLSYCFQNPASGASNHDLLRTAEQFRARCVSITRLLTQRRLHTQTSSPLQNQTKLRWSAAPGGIRGWCWNQGTRRHWCSHTGSQCPRGPRPSGKGSSGLPPAGFRIGHQTKFVLPDAQQTQMQTVEARRGFLH